MPYLNTPSVIIKRNVFERIGMINSDLYVDSDYKWFLRLHRTGGYGIYNNKIFVNHRLGGISSKHLLEV